MTPKKKPTPNKRLKKATTATKRKTVSKRGTKKRSTTVGWVRGKVHSMKLKKPKYNWGNIVCLKTDRKTPCEVVGTTNSYDDQPEEVKYKIKYLASAKKNKTSDWIVESKLVRYRKPQ